MKIKTMAHIAGLLALALATLSSCKDNTSYADLLKYERFSTNAYLSNFRVVDQIPADTVFEEGPDAPFYKIEPEGNVYMQVLRAGDRKKNAPKTSQRIYFRYMRYNLNYWHDNGAWDGVGNEKDMDLSTASFSYNNYTLPESSQWGYGLQMPLPLLGVDCEVNLIIKSQFGLSAEISYVQPYMFHVRYFTSQI